MAKNTSIELGHHLREFVAGQVSSGRYGSASEVIRSALRLLEEHDLQVERLRQALIAGENSGEAKALDIDRFVADKLS